MPPKKTNTAEEEPTLADLFKVLKIQSEQLTSLHAEVGSIKADMKKVDSIELEVKNIKTMMVELKEENAALKAEIKQKDAQLTDMQGTVNQLENRFNNLEQHHRGWGARVLNIQLSEEEEKSPELVINKVYNLAILPVLRGAANSGKLSNIPTADQVLEIAHVLPGKQGYPKPIIMRFYNRNLRNLVFQLKKDFATREPVSSGASTGRGDGGSDRVGRFLYPLYDDLTKMNLAKMRAIGQDERVLACWSVGGQIRFKLKDAEGVRKVNNILDPLEMIIK
jgi:hypothetical protein